MESKLRVFPCHLRLRPLCVQKVHDVALTRLPFVLSIHQDDALPIVHFLPLAVVGLPGIRNAPDLGTNMTPADVLVLLFQIHPLENIL